MKVDCWFWQIATFRHDQYSIVVPYEPYHKWPLPVSEGGIQTVDKART